MSVVSNTITKKKIEDIYIFYCKKFHNITKLKIVNALLRKHFDTDSMTKNEKLAMKLRHRQFFVVQYHKAYFYYGHHKKQEYSGQFKGLDKTCENVCKKCMLRALGKTYSDNSLIINNMWEVVKLYDSEYKDKCFNHQL